MSNPNENNVETKELFDDRWFAPLFDRKYKF